MGPRPVAGWRPGRWKGPGVEGPAPATGMDGPEPRGAEEEAAKAEADDTNKGP